MAYTSNNVFAKILKGEIPFKKFYEDDMVLCFPDLQPLAAVHLLIIPKNPYSSFDDFSSNASDQEISSFFRAIKTIARKAGVDQTGYRLIANHGLHAHQEVPHFHFHLLGGQSLGGMMGSVQKG
ncbi:MAG: HIT domain-containing protein [Alphaproteobacteria bacterium]